MKRAAFFTLGCKVNQFETQALERKFEAAGYEIVDSRETAEVYVVNSCTVTAEGDRKSRQALRRMRRQNPAAVVCLCGCFPQAFPEAAALIPEADIIMGSKDRAGLLDAVNMRLSGGERLVAVSPHHKGELFEDLETGGFSSKTRAILKIEDGCEHHCAYCVIPRARGPVRSKPLDKIKDELIKLAKAGFTEVVLAGINLGCYGKDSGLRLYDAVRTACEVDGISRVRLSSLEPDILSDEDIRELSCLKKLCPHFHFSLQSGCDATLKRMGRRYTADQYARVAAAVRAAFDNPAITTDIMVGFPGETDAEFEASLKFCGEMGFAKAHVFAYSRREGTRAAEMPEQIDEAVKRRRSADMIAVTDTSRAMFLESQTGKKQNVLFEAKGSDGMWEGYSENYTPVAMRSDADLNGKIITVTPSFFDMVKLVCN